MICLQRVQQKFFQWRRGGQNIPGRGNHKENDIQYKFEQTSEKCPQIGTTSVRLRRQVGEIDMLGYDVRVYTCATLKCCVVLSFGVSFLTGRSRSYLPIASLPHIECSKAQHDNLHMRLVFFHYKDIQHQHYFLSRIPSPYKSLQYRTLPVFCIYCCTSTGKSGTSSGLVSFSS